MKILTNKQMEYLFEQIEVREEMIKELIEISDYYGGEVQILLDMIQDTTKALENMGINIRNKKKYVEVICEVKKTNNLTEERLNIIRKVRGID